MLKGDMGSPRVRAELHLKYGKRVSLKKVVRLMRENKLNARVRRSFVRTTNSKHGLAVCENLLNREFSAGASGQKWVSSYLRYAITYLHTTDGWVYLTTVMDLFDRRIIGWALSADMEAEHMTVAAVKMAFKNRPAQEGLLFHSDRGVQYCAQSFRVTLGELCPTVCQSMSRKGNCWDNAIAESFFKTIKRELETLDGKHSAAEVRQAVFMYIEAYYNRIRIHSGADYLTPDMFYLVPSRLILSTERGKVRTLAQLALPARMLPVRIDFSAFFRQSFHGSSEPFLQPLFVELWDKFRACLEVLHYLPYSAFLGIFITWQKQKTR